MNCFFIIIPTATMQLCHSWGLTLFPSLIATLLYVTL